MQIFSSAFTLERNQTTDVNVRTGAFNASFTLATLPTCWDPQYDYTLALQFQPGAGFSSLDWLVNLPYMDLTKRQLTTLRGQVFRLTSNTCNCKLEYPKFENIEIVRKPASFRAYRYEVWHDDRSCEYFDDLGKIVKASTDLDHELKFEYYPSSSTTQGRPFPKKISNLHGDSIEFTRKFETSGLDSVDVKLKLLNQTSIVRVQLKKENDRQWIESISLPDHYDEKFKFEYEYRTDKPRRLTKVTTPTGLVKTMTYTELPIFDPDSDSDNSKMDAVQKFEISDLGSPLSPIQKFEYDYSPQSNYLGYRPGVTPTAGEDAMFAILDDDYRYWTIETERGGAANGLNTKRTYNRFHLLEKEEKYLSTSGTEEIVELYEYTYPIKAGESLLNQDSQFSTATTMKVTTTDNGATSVMTSAQTVDEGGHILTRSTPDEIQTVKAYSSIVDGEYRGIFRSLMELSTIPPVGTPFHKSIRIVYSLFRGLRTNAVLPSSSTHYFRADGEPDQEQYVQRFSYFAKNEGLTPNFFVGSIKSTKNIINNIDGAQQKFEWVRSPVDGNVSMLKYSYGVGSSLVYGGRAAHNRMRQALITYDASDRKSRYTYDTLNQITAETIYADTPKAETTTYAYRRWQSGGFNEVVIRTPGQPDERQRFNAYGHHISTEILVPNGPGAGWQVTKSVRYDQRQLPIETKDRDFYTLAGAGSPDWHDTLVSNRYDDFKRLIETVSADGISDRFSYDRALRLQSRFRNGSMNACETWQYSVDGKIISHERMSSDIADSPINSKRLFGYDGFRRLFLVVHSYPIGGIGPFSLTEYRYDYHDRVIQELHYVTQSLDNPVPTDPCQRITYTYDPSLRSWSMGLVAQLTVDSNKPNTDFLIAKRTYDTAGRVLTEDDGAGRKLTYTYATEGEPRPNKVMDASYAGYDQSFDVTTGAVTRRKLLTTQQEYTFGRDSFNRLTGVTLKNSQGVIQNEITFTYDEFGRQVGEASGDEISLKTLSVGGRLLRATPGDIHCYYDIRGRLAKKTYAKPHASVSHSMDIDIQYFAGAMSRMSLNDAAAGMVASIAFTHVDGRETERVYTVAGQERLKISSTYADPMTLKKRSYAISSASTTLEESFSFDTQDRLSSIAYKMTVGTTVSDATTTFTFDEHARIKTASGGTLAGTLNDSYAYKTSSTTGAPDMLESITRAGSAQNIAYQSGNMSNAVGAASLTYSDQQNLLNASNPTPASPNDLRVQCTYDALNRFTKSVVTQTRPTALSHDVSYQFVDRVITGEVARPVPADPTKYERTAFFRANGVLLGRVVIRPDPPTAAASFAEIFATDASGSVRGVFGYQGDSVLKSTYYTYDAYGRRSELSTTSNRD